MTTKDFNLMIASQGEFLRPYAQSLTHNTEDANDLFQETMLKALLNKDKYSMGTNLKGWLYTIMRNIFINGYRKKKRFSLISADVSEDVVINYANVTAKNDGWGNARLAEVKTAMNDLPKDFSVAFELHYIGYKYKEIAGMLNEPIGTIKSRIHFARKVLSSKIDK